MNDTPRTGRSPFDRIERRRTRALVGVVVIGLLVLLGVRLLDPTFAMDTSSSVDLSDPTREIVHDAIADLRSTDYAVTVSAKGVPLYERRVENTDRQSFTNALGDPAPERRQFFSTDGMEWYRRGSGPWRKRPPGLFHPDYDNPLDAPRNASDATVVDETERTLVIRVDDRDTVREIVPDDTCPGPVVLEIDRESRRLTELRRLKQCPDEQWWVEYRFTDYGETDVTRPDGVPRFSPEELFWDVFRTELWPVTVLRPA